MNTLRQIIIRIFYLRSIKKSYKKIRRLYKNDFLLFKTICVNFKLFPYKTAKKLPIFIYDKVKIRNLGTVEIDGKITTGMIHLGLNTDQFSASKGCALFYNTGIICFKGNASFSVDYTIINSNYLEIGNCAAFGGNVKIRASKKIIIGDYSRIAIESQIFDDNFHYVKDITTGNIHSKTDMIVIGKYCWIGNRTTIMKGTILPDYCLVTGNSLLNKDYSKTIKPASLIGGTPAKLIREGVIRIFSNKTESMINKYFKDNPNNQVFNTNTNIEDESDDIQSFFSQM